MYEGAILTDVVFAAPLRAAGSQSRQSRCWQYVLLTCMLYRLRTCALLLEPCLKGLMAQIPSKWSTWTPGTSCEVNSLHQLKCSHASKHAKHTPHIQWLNPPSAHRLCRNTACILLFWLLHALTALRSSLVMPAAATAMKWGAAASYSSTSLQASRDCSSRVYTSWC